jgi:hypothetical protein
MNGPASLLFTFLLIADLPFSFFAFGVMFTSTTYGGVAFVLWGIGGTLWWHLLGRAIDAVIRRIRGKSADAEPLIDSSQSDATVTPALFITNIAIRTCAGKEHTKSPSSLATTRRPICTAFPVDPSFPCV